MGHWAQIDNDNIVINVVIADDDKENFLSGQLGGKWIQTSYNTMGGTHYNPETGEPSEDQSKALRKNYAGIGYTYDSERDAFIPPKPFESWVLNEATCLWEAPIPMPEDGSYYEWNEETQSWDPENSV